MPKLTEKQFDALATLCRWRVGSGAYIALYQVLVNGATMGDAARLAEVSYINVYEAVKSAKHKIGLCEEVVK